MATPQRLEADVVNPRFGQMYGCGPQPAYVTTDGTRVWMWRKGTKVRFYDALANQVGPDHANVVPAIVWAAAHGWVDPTALALSVAVCLEVQEQSRRFDERNTDAGAWQPIPEMKP